MPWPPGITATQVGGITVKAGDPNSGTAQFSLANVFAVPSATVTASADVTCASFRESGGTGLPVTPAGGAAGSVTVSLDLAQEGGSCSVSFTLSDGPGGPYGAGTTQVTGAMTVNPPPLSVSPANYTAAPLPLGRIQVVSSYQGGGGIGWAVDIVASPSCTSINTTPGGTGGPWTTTGQVPSCVTGTTVDVQVTFTYAGSPVLVNLGNVAVTPVRSGAHGDVGKPGDRADGRGNGGDHHRHRIYRGDPGELRRRCRHQPRRQLGYPSDRHLPAGRRRRGPGHGDHARGDECASGRGLAIHLRLMSLSMHDPRPDQGPVAAWNQPGGRL